MHKELLFDFFVDKKTELPDMTSKQRYHPNWTEVVGYLIWNTIKWELHGFSRETVLFYWGSDHLTDRLQQTFLLMLIKVYS